MAFVYRSQKLSPFQNQSQNQTHHDFFKNAEYSLQAQVNVDVSSKNSTSSKKLFKGLPSLLLKKPSNNQNQLIMFQKENHQAHSSKKSLVNIQKLKQQTQNYFFSSKVPRQPYGILLRQIQKNNSIISHTNLFSQTRQIDQQKPLKQQTNTLTQFPNKNLLRTAGELNYQFKKASIQLNELPSEQLNKLLVGTCIKQDDGMKMKRKSSPPKNMQVNYKNVTHGKSHQSHMNNQNNHNHNDSGKIQKQHYDDYSKNNETLNTTTNNLNNQSIQLNNKNKETINNAHSLVNYLEMYKNKKNSQRKICSLKKGPLNSSFYKDDDEDESGEEYYDEIPGPGTYENSFNIKGKKSFRSKKQKFAKIFVSPLQRFSQDTIKYHQITYVNQDNTDSSFPKKSNKNQSFLSKSPKFESPKKKSQIPSPGFYNVRQSIQHDVVKNLLKSANTIFCSSVPRFNYKKKEFTPGPGQYNIESLDKIKKQEQKDQLSYSYRSEVKRELGSFIDSVDKIKQNEQKIKVTVKNDDNPANQHAIHSKQDSFDSSEFFTAPPFMSGVERFNSSFQQQEHVSTIKYFKSEKESFNNKVAVNNKPFNSGSKRQLSETIGEGIGVGSYGTVKDKWNKKSYNVLFH